jgi:hypothetical protein
MKYNCVFDGELAEAATQAAGANFRSTRQQIILYVTQGLQRDGYLPLPEAQNKTGLSSLVGNKPVTDTQQAIEE